LAESLEEQYNLAINRFNVSAIYDLAAASMLLDGIS